MGYKRILFLLPLAFAALIFVSGCGKKGCTDPKAQNFEPDATKNDGCIYDRGATSLINVVDDGSGVGTVTWRNENIYVLEGLVYVNSGQTLTIEPGTIIKCKADTGAGATALIVAQGGVINANGTPNSPIIFTAESDNLDRNDEIVEGTRGLWGGLILLGNGRLNATLFTEQFDGIPANETRGKYGGQNDADNSGILSYVSIRYAGGSIGGTSKLAGLNLAGVGSSTDIHHVEVIFSGDDGIRFNGGATSSKYMISAFNGDDCFVTENGYRGKGQFWFSIQDGIKGEYAGDNSGGAGNLYSHPVVYNATHIGRGQGDNLPTAVFQENTQGEYHNSIFIDHGKGIQIAVSQNNPDAIDQFNGGKIRFYTNVFWNVGSNTAATCLVPLANGTVPAGTLQAAADTLTGYFGVALNSIADPLISISRTRNGTLNPLPQNSAVLAGATVPSDGYFTPAVYRGAFDGVDNWLLGWTFLDEGGYLE
ncbi:MAG: T9SS C-terminal target domain-containing protein [Bacteroidia bacterium]|nr:T9SS C-terminal target domain-containing protein [Bacteroidia bacterium]